MSLLRVAALQMISGFDLQANLALAETQIQMAVEQGASLLVLPEVFALFGANQQLELGRREAFGDAPVSRFLSEQAARHGVWIVGGSVPFSPSEDNPRVLSACVVYDEKGIEKARYNKLHLFDAQVDDVQASYRESDTFQAGDSVVVVETPLGRLGLSICYDIRFPEFFRAMFAMGVDLIAVPAAFTLNTGLAHWLALLRARAIENQCYIIGANQGGQHSRSRHSSGGSVIIDGWGRVLAEAGRGNTVISADIDLSALARQRKAMPIAQHQRFATSLTPGSSAQ